MSINTHNYVVISSEINVYMNNELEISNGFWNANNNILKKGALYIGVISSRTESLYSSFYYKSIIIKILANIEEYLKFNIEAITVKDKINSFYSKYRTAMCAILSVVRDSFSMTKVSHIVSLTTYLDTLNSDHRLNEIYLERKNEQILITSIEGCPYSVYTHIKKYNHKTLSCKKIFNNIIDLYRIVQENQGFIFQLTM